MTKLDNAKVSYKVIYTKTGEDITHTEDWALLPNGRLVYLDHDDMIMDHSAKAVFTIETEEKQSMNFKKFNGKKIEEMAKYLEDISCYNNNYYEDDEGNIIYADSDDDNYTEYTRVTITDGKKQYLETFAESYTSDNDVIRVFDCYLNEV